MKKSICLSVLMVLLFAVSAFADSFVVRPSGFWIPKQEMSASVPGVPIVEFNTDNSFGGFVEIAKYSPKKYLSFGLEGGFENLKVGSIAPGISEASAKVFSLMVKGCGHVQNKSKFTPFGCGGIGMLVIDPDMELASGAAIALNKTATSGFSMEAGGSYAFSEVALRAGVRMIKAFDDPVFSVAGGAVGIPVDIDHYGVFFGLEF